MCVLRVCFRPVFFFSFLLFRKVVMNRIATLLEANAGRHRGEIDSEWVLGHHLLQHRISVSGRRRRRRLRLRVPLMF